MCVCARARVASASLGLLTVALGRQNDNKERDEVRTYDKGTFISYVRGQRTYMI